MHNVQADRRSGRRTFDRAQIIAAGLTLLDEGGVGALSIRAVAAKLAVNPNSVYTYVDSRAALESEVVEAVLRGSAIDLLFDGSLPWDERIVAYAISLRQTFHRHPAAALLMASTRADGPEATRIGEGLLFTLGDADFSLEQAARGAHAILVQIIGSIAFEIAETASTSPLPAEDARIAARRELLADLADAPRTGDAAETVAGWISTEQFTWGLETLLSGLSLHRKGQ